jgi:ATP-dependent Clp protease, protease subunit
MSQTPNLAGLTAADRLLHQRIIVLGQEVDDAIANKLCAELLLLSAEDPRRDIALYINSPGGSVSAGLAIYDTMRLIPNDVATLAMGLAASMGQFLLSAGTPGKRFALPHSRILMHQGSAGIGGTAIDIEIQAENLEHTKNVMMRLIAEHTGQPVERIERDARRDRWFTAEEAREYGFVDAVLTDVAEVTTQRTEPAVDIYSRLLTDRIVYIGTEIDDGVANVVIAQLLHLESDSPSSPIDLYLNSPGGSVTAMLAIYDTLQFISSPVGTTAIGQAGSSAAVLLAAGEPGRRHVLPHSRVVLHQPSGGGQGALPDLALQAKEIVRLRSQMESILARHTGRDPERIREDTERDLVLSAPEAIDYGLADAVLDSRKLPLG